MLEFFANLVGIVVAAVAAALSLVVHAAGGAQIATTPLLTVEDIDAACKKSVPYRAPGA